MLLREKLRAIFGKINPIVIRLSLSLDIRISCVIIKKFCPKKGKNKGKWDGNGSTSYDSAVVVHSSDDEGFCDDSPILLAVASKTRLRDQRILDSGCSYYITSGKNLKCCSFSPLYVAVLTPSISDGSKWLILNVAV